MNFDIRFTDDGDWHPVSKEKAHSLLKRAFQSHFPVALDKLRDGGHIDVGYGITLRERDV